MFFLKLIFSFAMCNAAEPDVFKLLAVRNEKIKPMSRFGYKNIFLLRVS